MQASATKTSTTEFPTLAMTSPPTAGNAIIVGLSCIATFGSVPGDNGGDCTIPAGGVTDSWGNTYTLMMQSEKIESSQQGGRGFIFLAHPITAMVSDFSIKVDPDGAPGDTPPNGDTQRVVWGAIEVAGLAPSSFDASGSVFGANVGGLSTTIPTDLPTTQANELAVAVFTMRDDNDTNMLITPELTWTMHHANQTTAGNAGLPGHSMISKVLTQAGVVSHTWTHDIPDRGTAAIIATFKGASPN